MKTLVKTIKILFILAFTACQQNQLEADLIVTNATIISMDTALTNATAFAVLNNRFIYVGNDKTARQFQGNKTKVIDAKGKTIVPGFNDCHIHPKPIFPFSHHLGRVYLNPDSIATMDDLIAALTRKAEITPEGQWITGGRYQDTKLGRHPTAKDLDKATTRHPVMIKHSSGHVCVMNSYALEKANISKNTPNPPGGAFDRFPNGQPNGICKENARLWQGSLEYDACQPLCY